MNHPETPFEDNLERLLQRSCGPNVRATTAMQAKLRREWLAEVRPQARLAEFPTGVLGVMSGVLAIFAVLCAASLWSGGWRAVNSPAVTPFSMLVLVNLLCLPVASLVIILRRRYARAC